jgi:hypothetical protein
MKRVLQGITGLLVIGAAITYGRTELIPAGTNIEIRTTDRIDMHDSSDGRIFRGVVNRDVVDADGNLAIPRGANAELTVRNLGEHELGLDLESVTVDGRRYAVSSDEDVESAGRRDGVGANRRTGKFVGGGAVLGTIIGAIGGGGKGAAIGAAAGAAAGAGTQTLTRGRDVKVPSESVITFRLNRDLRVHEGPNGRSR